MKASAFLAGSSGLLLLGLPFMWRTGAIEAVIFSILWVVTIAEYVHRIYRHEALLVAEKLSTREVYNVPDPMGEKLKPRQGYPGEPDFDALGPSGYSHLDETGASWKEKRRVFEEDKNRLRRANWWNWTPEEWAAYLEYNEAKREELGDFYEENVHFEEPLLEFGRWMIEHPDAEDEEKIQAAWGFADRHLFRLLYWREGIEPPSDLLSDTIPK